MIRINLLSVREIRAEFGRRQELTIAGVSLALTLALALGVHLFQSIQLSKLEKEQEGLGKEIGLLNAKVKEVGDLRKNISDLKAKNQVIEDLMKKKTGPVRIMESLSSATPSRLWLMEFKETGGNLAISGLAVDNQTIADFLKALAASAHFKNVELVETTQIEQEGVPLKKFSLKSSLLYQLPAPPAAEKPGVTPPVKEGTKG